MSKLRLAIVAFALLAFSCLGLFAWAHRSFHKAPVPGFAWFATTDGTTTNKTGRLLAVFARHGIPAFYDSMMVADIYVPTNQVANARMLLLLERLTFRGSVWYIH